MNIQEVAPQIADGLGTLDSDYRWAVVHVAWNRHKSTSSRRLLFAFVELLPLEIPPPIDDYDPKSGYRLGGESEHRVSVRHAAVPARVAVDWYRNCRCGVVVLPNNNGQLPEFDDLDATKLEVDNFSEEPTWPVLSCATDDTDTLPFCPQWMESPRVHHLIPASGFSFDLWTDEERRRAASELENKLHFNIEDYPEYWGSVHLLAPNPVYRRIHSRLQLRDDGGESDVQLFEPRAGQSVRGLVLSLHERTDAGATDLREVNVSSEVLRFNFDRKIGSVREEVYDPVRGALKVSNSFAVFIAAIEMRMKLSHTSVVNPGTPGSFEVTRSGPGEVTRIGDTSPSIPSARSRMAEGHRTRKRRAQAIHQDQHWFRGEVDQAKDLLRGLIHSATTDVLFVDPYFGAAELGNFALAVGQDDVPIRILTSSLHLKTRCGVSVPSVQQGERLQSGLELLRSQGYSNPFDIRVMLGESPAVHDRFLVVDERVWLLGSSLNNFGDRGTMIVLLPDPVPVHVQLMNAWSEASPFADWLTHRSHAGIPFGEDAT